MKVLRKGFTTGTAAAAATKAAISRLVGQESAEVTVTLPGGELISISVRETGVEDGDLFYAEVVKDAGDDPDVTNGAIIRARVRRRKGPILITGGVGVGRVTKPGLPVSVGEAAINPAPRKMIETVIREAAFIDGLEVVIEVPQGKQLAEKTLNPRLGIIGGISILGTTGIVEPMSEVAWQDSLALQLGVIKATGSESVVLTPGRQGLKWAVHKGIPENRIAEMSNFVGFMLDKCEEYGFRSVLFWGHYGKLIKVAAGNFNTHSHLTDAKLETLTALTALSGGNKDLLAKIFTANTTEEAVGYLAEQELDRVILNQVAARVSSRVEARNKKLASGCILIDRQGEIRGMDEGAGKIIEAEQWPIKL